MKNIKIILPIVLSIALLISSLAVSFAAPIMNESTDKRVVEAVERLSAFGIVNGMEDGKYHEEMKVTREQITKLLVEALGLGNIANSARGSTKFSDVEYLRWSSGYINVAVAQGLIKGYEDKTFKPAAQVSYAEAATMLVRALGYKDEFLKGLWPNNYIIKAVETGISNGSEFVKSSDKINRGIAALLVNNTLDSKIIKVKEYTLNNIKFEETNKTLLKDKLGLNKYENVRILSDKLLNDSLDKNEVTIRFLKGMDEVQRLNVKNEYKVNEVKEFELYYGLNIDKMIGKESTVYLNNNNQIIFAADENDDKEMFDYIESSTLSNKASLVKFNGDYEFEKDADVFIFNKTGLYKAVKGENVKVSDLVGKPGKFVIKNNKIVYAQILDANEGEPWLLVKENKDGMIFGISQSDEEFEIDLSQYGNYDEVVVFDQSNNRIQTKDIKSGNLLYIQGQYVDGDNYAVVKVITNNVVKGRLEKIKDDRIEIDGKEIEIINYSSGDVNYDAYYSIDEDENSKQWHSDDWNRDMEYIGDAQVTLYLDGAGRMAYLSSEVKSVSEYKYGIVTKTYSDNEKIKIYTVDDSGSGIEMIYNVEEYKNLVDIGKLNEYGQKLSSNGGGAVFEGSVVKFRLNKAGEISEDELFMMNKDNYYEMNPGKDFGKNSISSKLNGVASSHIFSIDSNAIIIDAKKLTEAKDKSSISSVDINKDFGTVKWIDMAEDDYNSELKYYAFTSDSSNIDVKAIIFIGTEGALSFGLSEPIYVIDAWKKSGDMIVKYSDEKGQILESKVHENPMYVLDESLYISRVTSNGKIDLNPYDLGKYTKITGVISDKNENIIKVNGKDYKLSISTIVYEEDIKKSTSNVRKGDAVSFIVQDSVNIKVLERLVDSEADLIY